MTELAALPSRTLPPQPVEPPAAPASIPTRFGELAVSPERLIAFPSGVLGFAECQRYALADLPDPQVVFKLLQSIDAPELAFLVLPLDPAAGPIGRSDLERACRELGFDWHTLVVLGIVTIRSDPEGVRFSINLKAPLLIDSRRQVGRQHVFASEVYPLRHDLPRAHAA
ncbi:MAG TPA: flagellar assembly protein FliW [Geminicoccaceae bacterium]|nr:flagellar assembly protein FliW [Geminicoccaceae bacterium]